MTVPVKAVVVCVDYWGELAATLPINAPHFAEVVVATTPKDVRTQAVVAAIPNARCHLTNVFTARGAAFNKGAALEEAFDVVGQDGWITVLDADTVLPRRFEWPRLKVGLLYSPRRRMMVNLPNPLVIPPDEEWSRRFPLHPQSLEWAGYFQLFNAADPVLRERPWYPTNYYHAGTVDSLFQFKWLASHKVRPSFEVLHIGPPGTNWAGRVSPFIDGTLSQGADRRRVMLRNLLRLRGTDRTDRFRHERLPPQ